MQVAVVDYGAGNLRSVELGLRRAGASVTVSNCPKDLHVADKIVLPGVGSFAPAMRVLHQFGLLPILNAKAHGDRTPILGICLGMQMFSSRSEEGDVEGLGWIDAATRRLPSREAKIPHLGWSEVHAHRQHPCMEGIDADTCFYFAHSYHVDCQDAAVVLGWSRHGIRFASAIAKDNLFGIQFHPEKSHRQGMKLLENFVRWQV